MLNTPNLQTDLSVKTPVNPANIRQSHRSLKTPVTPGYIKKLYKSLDISLIKTPKTPASTLSEDGKYKFQNGHATILYTTLQT